MKNVLPSYLSLLSFYKDKPFYSVDGIRLVHIAIYIASYVYTKSKLTCPCCGSDTYYVVVICALMICLICLPKAWAGATGLRAEPGPWHTHQANPSWSCFNICKSNFQYITTDFIIPFWLWTFWIIFCSTFQQWVSYFR